MSPDNCHGILVCNDAASRHTSLDSTFRPEKHESDKRFVGRSLAGACSSPCDISVSADD